MTNREFYEAITASTLSDEIKEFAANAIVKLDATNAKRRDKNAEKADHNAPLVDKFVALLNDKPQTATDLLPKFDGMARADGKAFNIQFVSRLGMKAVEAGKAEKVDVKVKGKGTQKGYIAC